MKITVPCHFTERKSYIHLQSRVGANIAKVKLFDLFTASQSSVSCTIFICAVPQRPSIDWILLYMTLNSSLNNYKHTLHKGPFPPIINWWTNNNEQMSFQARLYDPKELVLGVSENSNFLTQLTHINFKQYFHLLLILTHTP